MPRPPIPISDDTLAKVIALATRQGGLIRWDQLLDAGVTDSQARTLVRRGVLHRVRHGVLGLAEATSPVDSHRLQCLARWKSLPDGAVLSHDSAWLLHGLADVDPPSEPTFLIPRAQRGDMARARLGSLPPEHCTVLHGMPVTTAARTVVDVLRRAEDDLAAQALADAAIRGDVDDDDVQAVLAYCSGWPAVTQAREAWAHADARSESVLESRHRALFRRLGLPTPEIQVPIFAASGRQIARVDFLFRDQRTVVESDGRIKYEEPRESGTGSGQRALWMEKLREDGIRDTGLEVVRATWADSVDGGEDLDRRVRHAFERSARRGAA